MLRRARPLVLLAAGPAAAGETACWWDQGRLVVQVRMEEFKHGIKRIRVAAGTRLPAGAGVTVIATETVAGADEWVVRDWTADSAAALARAGVTARDVIDLDLEEAFVELLRSFRQTVGRAA